MLSKHIPNEECKNVDKIVTNCQHNNYMVHTAHMNYIIIIIIIIFSGIAAQRWLWPPHSRGFLITHNDAPQSVGLLWTSDQLVAETST
jgi:hypothetical protein